MALQIFTSLYRRVVIGFPKVTIFTVLALVLTCAYFVPQFQFDASSDTLLLKNDPNLEYYRSIKGRYGSDDYLVITYSPSQDLFSQAVLNDLKNLKQDLLSIKNVDYVFSILDAPLVKSPPITIKQLNRSIYNIENENVDLALARQELLTSPVYKDLLVSNDTKTTAIVVGLISDKDVKALITERDNLRAQRLDSTLTLQQQQRIKELTKLIEGDKENLVNQVKHDIEQVREVMHKYQGKAELFLGGLPMITVDSIDYIRHDVFTFGWAVFVLLIGLLVIVFGELRWVLLPLLTCGLVGVTAVGLFGWFGWPVTVVSSNFLPLLLITTLSLIVHLIVKYREIQDYPAYTSVSQRVWATIQEKFNPCFYTALTTIVAFCSLLISGIQPLIDFGLMMTIGIAISFVFAFTFFPAALVLANKAKAHTANNHIARKFNLWCISTIKIYPKSTIIGFMAISVLGILGILQLSVENRFIDYFKKDTEIYQGMEVIDKALGGTTPLDVIINAPKSFYEQKEAIKTASSEAAPVEQNDVDEDDDDDFWEEDELGFEDTAGIAFDSYFFNTKKIKELKQTHDYLESLNQTGKVLSLVSSMDMLHSLDIKTTYDDMYLSIMYATIPEKVKKNLIAPYVSDDGNQLRFSVRVFETDYTLKRQALLNRIKTDLTTTGGFAPEQVKLTGMLVMYNNMLQSFFKSQILTLGIVFVCIFFMFCITFKSVKVAFIAIWPNVFAAVFVLGIMGWLNIPLDLMTITIAAICVGIAVDDTIHYVHRMKIEYNSCQDMWLAARRSHGSIGLGMLFTTVIVTLGFSVLIFSNFVPTIHFGLLTGCSLIIALIADMALLPVLLALSRAFD